MRRGRSEMQSEMRKRWLVAAGAVLTATIGVVLVPAASGRAGRHRDPFDAAGPLDIRVMGVNQATRDVELRVRTQGRFGLKQLNRRPDTDNPTARFLCLHLHRPGSSQVRQLCFGPKDHGKDVLGYAKLHGDGSVKSFERLRARVERRGPRSISARFRAHAAGLNPHVYFWRYLSHWRGRPCDRGSPSSGNRARRGTVPGHRADRRATERCLDQAPSRRWAKFRLHPVQPVGCTAGPGLVRNGSRGRKRVALTFDDGPSGYTPKILKILRHEHAKGTFFEVGAQVPGLASTSRKVIESGNELGNHSMRHESRPGSASMAKTSRRIRKATGFAPCLFRPPGGGYDSRVLGDAHRLGMTTVIWDVDPTDWSTPGAGAIYGRVVGATRPGSIVLMHDGGGNRSQTVAALPRIIHTLHGRGYRFVTVTKLLHQRTIWGEVH
jgi:peptidoglycan/xylan/chitin deacetylase (PgdA/CDA1 family)